MSVKSLQGRCTENTYIICFYYVSAIHLVNKVVCVFVYKFTLLGEQRRVCVNNLSKVVREAERPGLEPATSRLQVRRPNQ